MGIGILTLRLGKGKHLESDEERDDVIYGTFLC